MEEILIKYGELLSRVDGWLAGVMESHPSLIACRSGCSECCRGLFDITLLDGAYLKKGFDLLQEGVKGKVREKAEERLKVIRGLWPEFSEPYVLNYRPEEEWEALMPDDDETPCPLLTEDGTCLVYGFRPMTCRLHGFPLVDISGEVMHDEWCTMNFIGQEPLKHPQMRWDFHRLFRKELSLFRSFTHQLLNREFSELDTFIPTALLMDFKVFRWREWLENSGLSGTSAAGQGEES